MKEVVETNGRFEQVLKDNPTKNYLGMLRKKSIMSVADFERARKRNILNIYTSEKKTPTFKTTVFACACGSRNFRLHQHGGEITAKCAVCGNSEIIAWSGIGHVRDLETMEWNTPDLLSLLMDHTWLSRQVEILSALKSKRR